MLIKRGLWWWLEIALKMTYLCVCVLCVICSAHNHHYHWPSQFVFCLFLSLFYFHMNKITMREQNTQNLPMPFLNFLKGKTKSWIETNKRTVYLWEFRNREKPTESEQNTTITDFCLCRVFCKILNDKQTEREWKRERERERVRI